MQTDYPDAADACAEVSRHIRRDFPAAVFELTFHVRGQPHGQHHLGHGAELTAVLERCLSRFRGARVYYTPHHPYGLICLIECWCRRDGHDHACENCSCDSFHNRSSVTILLHERDDKPVLAGKRMPPAMNPPGEDTLRPWRAEDAHRH